MIFILWDNGTFMVSMFYCEKPMETMESIAENGNFVVKVAWLQISNYCSKIIF